MSPSLFDLPHVFVSQGRVAIWWALKLTLVAPEEEVLAPAYHCPTMIAPIVAHGANPVFYDISREGNPDLQQIRELITHKTRAVLAAHYFGLPVDMRPLRNLCEQHGIVLIEDCCHAFFGSGQSGGVGATGHFSIGSLPKFFPVLEGGILAASDSSRLLAAPKLETHSILRQIRQLFDILDLATRYGSGRNAATFLATSFQAMKMGLRATGTMKQTTASAPSSNHENISICPNRTITRLTKVLCSRLSAGVERRRENYQQLADAVAGIPGCFALIPRLPDRAVPYMFPLWVDGHTETVAKELRARGIPVFHWNEPWQQFNIEQYPNATAWASHVIQLPCHQSIMKDHVALISQSLRDVVRPQ